MGKKFSIDHFISEGEKRTTIYDIINRLESGKNAKRDETFCLDRYVIPWNFRAIHHGKWERSWSVYLPLFSPKTASFYQKHHSDGYYIFWPNQAGCHYAEHSLDFLCEILIHYVDKVDNSANLPEVRPIEDFWSILKAKVYENN